MNLFNQVHAMYAFMGSGHLGYVFVCENRLFREVPDRLLDFLIKPCYSATLQTRCNPVFYASS